VLLVWDEERFAIMVAKVLRPDVASDADALEDLREEAAAGGGDDDDDDDDNANARDDTATRSQAATNTGNTGVSTKPQTATQSRDDTRTKNTGVSTAGSR
jgi:hypothetical protein